jgi:hypothetical protein
MLQTNQVTQPLHCKGGEPEIFEFPGSVQGSRIINNVVVDVRPVGVCCNDKSVFALQKPLGKLVADAVSFLRRNFSRLEGLPHLIGDHIAFLAAPSGPLVVEVHGGGRIVEHRQQILLHVPHRGGVFCQRIQHEADVVDIQLFQPTAYYLGWLVISGDPQHLAFGRTGVHK